jgi:hypothetical protein
MIEKSESGKSYIYKRKALEFLKKDSIDRSM